VALQYAGMSDDTNFAFAGRDYAAPGRRTRELPTYYYHSHFVEMMEFVEANYGHVLVDSHITFIRDFERLPRDAQCLYVRLVNRKGKLFASNRLKYPELGDTQALVAILREQGWLEPPSEAHFEELLGFLTRTELYEALTTLFVGVRSSMKKAEYVAFARANCSPADLVGHVDLSRLVVQSRTQEIEFLMFLYFGRLQEGLTRFTMRDLGIVKTHSFRETFEPRFADREEALEHYFFETRLARLRSVSAGAMEHLLDEACEWPEPVSPGAAALRDKLAYRLGRKAEKAGDTYAALRLFQAGESAQCMERSVRILFASGQKNEARRYLERCIDDPGSDEEWLFATDFYERKFGSKRTSVVTDVLRAAGTIDIDEAQSGSPERAAADYFEHAGHRAFRVENALWRTFFGLYFWDELFAGDDADLHSPFEFVPRNLSTGTFYDDNRAAIDRKLAMLDEPGSVVRELLRSSTAHYGTPNGVFRWRRSVIDALFALLESERGDPLRQVLTRFCKDYEGSRYGYPDLLVLDDTGARFIEVKTEGDQLRRNQLLRIEQLRAAGFRADVVRVRWTLDPEQEYVVVDVETTGGRGENHRVTEIGAVKVRNGEIVGRFSTLLNPQRLIPPGITRLTGITPAMVEDAPYFSDIAEEFEEFMQGSIFVAHNVDFDYGFISREFGRLGRTFRYPRLCTCASMRKLYPGQRSYSLAALAETYDIPLRNQHRALCDAEAAAQLLLIVNEKRSELLAGNQGVDERRAEAAAIG
jgi:DNA polymerase-3 subunit epsilon